MGTLRVGRFERSRSIAIVSARESIGSAMMQATVPTPWDIVHEFGRTIAICDGTDQRAVMTII